MSINIFIEPHRFNINKEHEYKPYFLGGLLMPALFICFIGIGIYFFRSVTLPIKHIYMEGDFIHLSPNALEKRIVNKVTGNFFNVDVDAIRFSLLEEAWIKEVIVKRIWPDTLQITVIEELPVARWTNTGFFNKEGEHFVPKPVPFLVNIPLLKGPQGTEKILWEQFYLMRDDIKKIGFDITEINLDKRYSWSFRLKKGVKIILGRNNIKERFDRFLYFIPTVLFREKNKIESIDMRYTNGFSIKWKHLNK